MAARDALAWLDVLSARLEARRPQMEVCDRYYQGQSDLPFLTKAHQAKIRDQFRLLLEQSRSNFMRLVVDATEERLAVEGFRLSATTDQQADRASWNIWQANAMDVQSQVAFTEALVKGVSYLSVWDGGGYPTIAVEDPTQTIVGYEPGSNFQRRAAALKVWRDHDSGFDRANVYLPDGIYKFERPVRDNLWNGPWTALAAGEYIPNPLGVVPIVPLRNRPRLLAEGESELADVMAIQDQINGFLFLLALAAYFGGHRQRWATGLTLMTDDKGKPVEPFNAAVDRLWSSENPDARFGDFDQTNLDGFIKAIEQKVNHIAVVTRTPKHYLLPEGQEPSGDAIKSAESGLVKKVERKQRPFGEGIEEAIRLARLFAGEADAPVDSEVVWADPQVRSEAEIVDAAVKKFQVQLISREQALEDMGYSPQQITRIVDALAALPAAPATPTQ